jgi:hypothetical protein
MIVGDMGRLSKTKAAMPTMTSATTTTIAMTGRREAGRSVVMPYCAVSVPVIVCGWMSQT